MKHCTVPSVYGAQFGEFSLETLGVGTEPLVFNSLTGRRKPHDLYHSRDRVNVSRYFSRLFICLCEPSSVVVPLGITGAEGGEFQGELGCVKPHSAILFF